MTTGVGGASTATVTEADAVPPAPAHVITNVAVCAKLPMVSVPSAERGPVQALLARQLVALVEAQLSSVEPPAGTLFGLADKVTAGSDGGALTATETLAVVLPPGPEHSRA